MKLRKGHQLVRFGETVLSRFAVSLISTQERRWRDDEPGCETARAAI
jgi:hypothetical protein